MIALPSQIASVADSYDVVGLTSGCFDLIHFYHLHYFERCRAECDFLIVGVDADQLVFDNKKKTPINPEFHRAAMVEALRCVDAVFVMRNLNQFEAMAMKAEKVFKNDHLIYGQPVVVDKAKLHIIADVQELTSTSAIIQKIQEQNK